MVGISGAGDGKVSGMTKYLHFHPSETQKLRGVRPHSTQERRRGDASVIARHVFFRNSLTQLFLTDVTKKEKKTERKRESEKDHE